MSAFNVGKKVSAAVRILQRKRDASARATHLVGKKDPLIIYEKALLGQATGGKFPSVTFIERKQMSTKTSIKRIALVAAAALTLGGFSAVSASAAAPSVSGTSVFALTLGGGTTSAATQVVGGFASFTISETVTASGTAGVIGSLSSSGVGSIVSGAGLSDTSTVGLSITGGSSAATFPTSSVSLYSGAAVSNGSLQATAFTVSSSVAGVQTITYTPIDTNGAPGTAVTQTITWGATPVVSAQYSQIVMLTGTTGAGVTGTTAPVALTTTGAVTTVTAAKSSGNNLTAQAVIGVVTNSSATATMLTQKVTATITGPGQLSGGTTTAGTGTNGRSITITETGGVAYFAVYSDGTAGTSTITLSVGTVTLGTRTATFYGAPAKATVTQNLYIAKAGSTLGAPTSATDGAGTTVLLTHAYTVEVVDAAGNDVAGATVKAFSSDATIIQSSNCTESTSITSGSGFWNCEVVGATGAASGSTATVTFKVSSAANTTYDILATPITFAIGGSIASEALSLDASSYTPLAPLRLIVTAKDSKGNLAADVDGALVKNLVSSVAMGGSGLVSPSKTVNGVGKTSIGANYAPATAGDFIISAVDIASTVPGTALSVTGVSSGTSSDAQGSLALDAANAATDAANNAYDEAQNATQAASDALAAVTALSAQVEALIATVKSLAAMVAKIKAKVKA